MPHELVAVSRAFLQSCLSLGYPHCSDFNSGDEGVGLLPFNIGADGTRYGSAIVFLTEAVRRRPNLHITDKATVSKILFDGNRAIGVRYRRDGLEQMHHADKIILCAGPIRSPHLLLLSGIGPGEDLRKLHLPVVADSPGVGRSLQDHPCINLYWDLQDGATTELDHTGIQVALRYGTSSGLPLTAAQINCTQFAFGMTEDDIFHLDKRKVGMACHLYRILSKGSVTLDPRCVEDPPMVDYCYLSSAQDLNAMKIIVKEAFRIAATGPIAGMLAAPLHGSNCVEDLDSTTLSDGIRFGEWLRRNAVTGQHTSSSCRMGPHPILSL